MVFDQLGRLELGTGRQHQAATGSMTGVPAPGWRRINQHPPPASRPAKHAANASRGVLNRQPEQPPNCDQPDPLTLEIKSRIAISTGGHPPSWLKPGSTRPSRAPDRHIADQQRAYRRATASPGQAAGIIGLAWPAPLAAAAGFLEAGSFRKNAIKAKGAEGGPPHPAVAGGLK